MDRSLAILATLTVQSILKITLEMEIDRKIIARWKGGGTLGARNQGDINKPLCLGRGI